METRRIPLFPLNTVLFPGMLLPLHVFEERYQEMVRRCMDGDRCFGVSLIREGEEVGGPADPHAVGTTCRILAATPLGEGRLLLNTVGGNRFRIVRLLTGPAPYLEAEVVDLPEDEPGDLGELPERVGAALQEYVRQMLRLYGADAPELEIPRDPKRLSNLVGAVLQVAASVRQELLEESDPAARLQRELGLLNQSNAILSEMPARTAARRMRFDAEWFSPN
jgi:hypothetical protein